MAQKKEERGTPLTPGRAPQPQPVHRGWVWSRGGGATLKVNRCWIAGRHRRRLTRGDVGMAMGEIDLGSKVGGGGVISADSGVTQSCRTHVLTHT